MVTELNDTWVISALIASLTASVVIPGGLLLRKRGNARIPAPPRRALSRGNLESKIAREQPIEASPNRPRVRVQQSTTASQVFSRPAFPNETEHHAELQKENPENTRDVQELDFNPALYTVKAFGIATFAVTVGAVGLVLGVKNAMGIDDTQEFARRMRELVLARMPILSARIHRTLEELDGTSQSSSETRGEWNWPEAEQRLKDAYEQRGIAGWAEVAVEEIRAEEEIEREKRLALKENMKK
ncbi:hypothetical protein VNI00_006576 [Paramarasmius palmivorus]|uniref:Transmembrane protein 242 n=1 Tax=Paramarasmius palmivorus TaxID=297713 RepID=A0AAW0D8B2_9AGAR